MVAPVAGDGPADAVTRTLAARLDDPVLLFSAPRASTAVDDLVHRQIPVVACGIPLGHERRVSYVTGDDRDGVRFPPRSGHRVSRTVVLLGGCPPCLLVSVGGIRLSTRLRLRIG